MFLQEIILCILLTLAITLADNNNNDTIKCIPDKKAGRIRYENCLVNHLLSDYIKEERPSATNYDTVNLQLKLELQQVCLFTCNLYNVKFNLPIELIS